MWTIPVWPSRRMVSTMPKAVSGFTNAEAPWAGVTSSGSARQSAARILPGVGAVVSLTSLGVARLRIRPGRRLIGLTSVGPVPAVGQRLDLKEQEPGALVVVLCGRGKLGVLGNS